MFLKLRKYGNTDSNHILTSIKVPTNPLSDPKSCDQWTEITEPAKINKFILKRNQKHFGQAYYSTPFTVEPLSQQIPFSGVSEYSDLILLEGNFDDSEIPDITTLFILSLKQHIIPPEEVPKLQLEAFKTKIRKWKETTSNRDPSWPLSRAS